MKILVLALILVPLTGCNTIFNDHYSLIRKDGVIVRSLKSLEDCNKVKEELGGSGVCVID